MEDKDLARLRQQFLKYPGVTEENVNEYLFAQEQRADQKKVLVEEKNFSNMSAELWLDRVGYPRPPGWKSVFIYPGSFRLRNKFLFFLVLVAAVVMWLFL